MKNKKQALNRRSFVEIMGKGVVTVGLLPYFVASCSTTKPYKTPLNIVGIEPSVADKLVLAEGLKSRVVISWEDRISDQDKFGADNDYLAFVPLNEAGDEGILWSNHESVVPMLLHESTEFKRTKQEVDKELYNVGGSLVHIKLVGDSWKVIHNSKYNRRITGFTEIPFNWPEPIKGSHKAMGTLANCAGGVTPWHTVLTCEENYHYYYGETAFESDTKVASLYKWDDFYDNPPEHYGWVVEIDPLTGAAQKHVALGRCAHECATVKKLDDGRIVVYTGDDKADECIYKFISSKPGSMQEGSLYVADTDKGKWISLDIDDQPVLREKFKTQTNILTYLRLAAKTVGGTPQDRPEDIEIDPVNGHVLITLTNNTRKQNYFGSILKITEKDGKHDALEFTSQTYLSGGEENGFASPDNMVFDRMGNLWFASDISGYAMNKPPYESFKNNGLFLVMREGPQAGKVIQVASAPTDAEFTGPCFSPDGKTLFLSVQHPGERSASMDQLSSHWPDGGDSKPKSSVVAISGSLIDSVQNLS